MDDNVIGTSSYSEAMDLSDIDESGYEQEITASPEHHPQEHHEQQQQQQQQQQQHEQPQDTTPPVKVRKKPGRKPNPASPALRKAQNRAAQRAFRERKERHMKDLESNIRGIKDHRDRLLQENEKMSSENEILKAENWYLKGIVLSLQLVCLQHNLVIPQHCPHVDDQTLGVLNQSIPESIASYINVNSRNKLQISNKLVNDTSDYQNVQQQKQPYNISQPLPSGSLIITQDGVHSVPEKQRNNNTSWYHQTTPKVSTASVSSHNDHSQAQAQSPFNTTQQHPHPSPSSDDNNSGIYHNIPPLSPMSTATSTTTTENKESEQNDPTASLPKPVLLSNEPVSSNLAAIQTLRLRLRLQSACVRMQSIPFAIQPTLLQLTIPHDPRIDLIPTPHMRDRMILYREQFDLDDCFRCLLSGSVFHGGDPAVAGNWQLPAEFFEKYWFLTIDYNLRRTTNEWRKLQGLKEIKPNIMSKEDTPMSTSTSSSSPPQPSTLLSQQLHQSPLPPLYNHVNKEPSTTAPPTSGLSYADLSGYLGVQLNGMNKNNAQQQQQQQQQQQSNQANITPIQLTNGYGIMNAPSSATASGLTAGHGMERKSTSANQTSPWENLLMGQKSYDMMMTGLYNSNSNDMDQQPH